MRILKVTQFYVPFHEKGGPTFKVRAIARGLSARGHRPTVLTADLGLNASNIRSAGVEPSPWGWRAEQDGVEAIYLPRWARHRSLTLNPGVVQYCRRWLETFDVVHVYGLYDLLGPAVAYFCRRRGIPYVVEPEGMFIPIVRNIRLKHLYHRLFGEELLRGASRLIATSEQERSELVAGGIPESKIAIRRNGIEVPKGFPPLGEFRRKWGIAPETKVVLFLGRLVAKKSPDLMLEVFARWREQGSRLPASLLVFAGPDEGDAYRHRLESLARQLGLNGGVLFTGPLYDDAKWEAYRDADLFVLPSQNENFGNSAAEAIACGTPVLVTNRCGIAPMVDQRAGLVVPYDRNALQTGLAQLLEDERLRERLGAGCRELAGEFSWDGPIAQMEALYLQLRGEARREPGGQGGQGHGADERDDSNSG